MNTRLRYLYRAYRYRYRVDRAELRFLCDRLRPGQVAVDAGCHKGAYTYWMRRCVGSSGAVYAFEPQPQQVAYLRGVFSAMRYDNVVLVPMGLSDAAGNLPLHIPVGAGRTHRASFEVGAGDASSDSVLSIDVTTLDTLFTDQPRGPDFIKIDVEGHELAVLFGARQTLAKYQPTLLIECEPRHRPDRDVRSVFEFLQSLGYEGSFFQSGYRRPLAEFDPAVHQPVISETGRPPVNYVNNFAFERSSG